MILFLGDSFTWGQGLYYSNWIKNGDSIDDINKKLPPHTFHENVISYDDDLLRKRLHFPALVAQHFDKSYSIRYGNGGSNFNILNILKNINHQILFEGIELIVIQLTFLTRDVYQTNLVKKFQQKYNVNELEALFMIREHQIEKIVDFCKRPKGYQKYYEVEPGHTNIPTASYNKEIPVLFLCEEPEFGEYIEQRYHDNLVWIQYDYKRFNCLKEWKKYNEDLPENSDKYNMPGKQNILLSDEYPNLQDFHYSPHGHQIIANSIVHHINNVLPVFKNK